MSEPKRIPDSEARRLVKEYGQHGVIIIAYNLKANPVMVTTALAGAETMLGEAMERIASCVVKNIHNGNIGPSFTHSDVPDEPESGKPRAYYHIPELTSEGGLP